DVEPQQLSITVSKNQSVQSKQNIIARLLNRYTLICPQVSSGGMAAGGAAHKYKQTLVMPVITKEQVQAVCGWLFPWFVDLTELNFIKPERALLYKHKFYYVIVQTVFTALILND
ncbi:stress protein, partial [Pseudoalteromonas sp. S4491]